MLKVPSLVFDIELEDNGIGGQWQEEGDWEAEGIVSEIQRFVSPTTPTEARLLSDVKVAMQHARDGQDVGRLVTILQALGYRCSMRTALGGGDGADCLRNLRHTFITCDTPAAPGVPARRYLVDVQFKEQFIIAKATPRYAAILAAIPQAFVGPEEHLILLVNFLCSEMSTAFRQLGSVLPPWRQASSMLSKWQPRKSVDEGVLAAQQAAGAARPNVGAAIAAAAASPAAAPFAFPPPQQPRAQPQWPAAGEQAAAGLLPQLALAAPPHQQSAAVAITGGQRPSWEPARVIFGGNFASVMPAPAC